MKTTPYAHAIASIVIECKHYPYHGGPSDSAFTAALISATGEDKCGSFIPADSPLIGVKRPRGLHNPRLHSDFESLRLKVKQARLARRLAMRRKMSAFALPEHPVRRVNYIDCVFKFLAARLSRGEMEFMERVCDGRANKRLGWHYRKAQAIADSGILSPRLRRALNHIRRPSPALLARIDHDEETAKISEDEYSHWGCAGYGRDAMQSFLRSPIGAMHAPREHQRAIEEMMREIDIWWRREGKYESEIEERGESKYYYYEREKAANYGRDLSAADYLAGVGAADLD